MYCAYLINQRGETGILHGHGISTRKEQELKQGQGQGLMRGVPNTHTLRERASTCIHLHSTLTSTSCSVMVSIKWIQSKRLSRFVVSSATLERMRLQLFSLKDQGQQNEEKISNKKKKNENKQGLRSTKGYNTIKN